MNNFVSVPSFTTPIKAFKPSCCYYLKSDCLKSDCMGGMDYYNFCDLYECKWHTHTHK